MLLCKNLGRMHLFVQLSENVIQYFQSPYKCVSIVDWTESWPKIIYLDSGTGPTAQLYLLAFHP